MIEDPYGDFDLYEMLCGGRERPILIGRIPVSLQKQVGWATREIYLTRRVAQKIRFLGARLEMHEAMRLRDAVNHGDVFTDGPRSLLFLLDSSRPTPKGRPKYFFSVAATDSGFSEASVQTFFIRPLTNKKIIGMHLLIDRGNLRWELSFLDKAKEAA